MKKQKGFMNIQLFAEAEGTIASATDPQIDYESEYKKAIAERDSYKAEAEKQKGLKDKYASESAEYKKKVEAQMSDEEKRAADDAEREQRYKELQNEVYEMRVSTAFAKAGFDEKDYGDIAKKIVEVGGEQSNDFAKTLIEFVKKANKSAVASAKNGAIKDGAVPPKTSMAKPSDTKSDYQLYQESKTKTNNIVEL